MKKTLLIAVFTELTLGICACSGDRGAPAGEPGRPAALAALLGSRDAGDYAQALAPRRFSFPADHGPHPAFRNEWWYLTGNLDSIDGRRFGYELTLFRFALSPEPPDTSASAWRSHQMYVGHFALTDVGGGEFHASERVARGAAGLAGADADAPRVWLYDWSIRRRPLQPAAGGGWQLTASDGDLGLGLLLTPEKPPVLHGEGGLSRKSALPGNASYYYSIPRLQTSGRLVIGDREFDVSGLSWLDREWSSGALGDDQQGWDWFSLQLSDGSDLMFYQLRRTDGTRDAHSAGTFMPANRDPEHLSASDVELQVLDTWDSPAGGRYPIEWRLIVPALRIDLRIRPVLEQQELRARVRYWEGAVDVSGTRGASRVGGRGYVELTGYAGDAGARP